MVENRRNLFPLFLLGGGLLLLLAGLAVVFLNRPPQAPLTATPASVAQVQRVSLDDTKAAYGVGTAVFVDVRPPSSYEASHIPGALNIPLNELPTRLGELDADAWIITY